MEKDIDNLLYSRIKNEGGNSDTKYIDHYLEQYRMYLFIFNSTHDRLSKSNDFFLGLNTAIIAALGYLESKGSADNSTIFLFAPFVGIAICYCWYEIIEAYKKINRTKFKVIHEVERKLPLSLYEMEWELFGKGKDRSKYHSLSKIERKIPIIFIVLYIVIFLTGMPLNLLTSLVK